MSTMVFDNTCMPLRSLLWLAGVIVAVRGFNFSVGQTGQCDPLSVSWSGGQPPFQLLIIPPGGTIRNFTIPPSAFDDGSKKGSYVQQLGLPSGVQVMLSMSDATGIFAGGTSSLMTVGASQSGQRCNITDPGTDFFFSLDSTLAQCSPYEFTHYGGAVLPITILVHIPQGQSFVVHAPPADSFIWAANLTAGTPVAFSVYDAENRIGGTSSVRVVQLTNDTSCLSHFPSPTSETGPKPSASNAQPPGPNGGTIKGLAVGVSIGILGLLGFSSLIVFCCYRQSRSHRRRSGITSSFVDLTYDPSIVQSHDRRGPPSLIMSVASTSTMAEVSSVQQTARGESCRSSRVPSIGHHLWYQPDPFLARSPQSNSQPRSSKWSIQNQDTTSLPTALTTLTYPFDVIVHTDLADLPLEVPPHYSASRTPLPGFPRSPMQTQNRDSI